jgi:hypothetical protein
VRIDRVMVAAPDPSASYVAGGAQLRDDPVRGPLGDPDAIADVAQADAGIAGDAEQDEGVVGEESPGQRGASMR